MLSLKKIGTLAAVAALLFAAPALAQYQPFGPITPKNLLDNPKFDIYQDGTTAVAISSSTTATVHADRWYGYTNNSSQAETLTNTTSSLPVGFGNAEQVGRTSGTDVHPICIQHIIISTDMIPVQGQAVSLSFYALAGAGLATGDATANTLSVNFGTGTTADEGYSTLNGVAGTFNSFTGAANPLATTQLISTTWTRYTLPAFVLGSTVNEGALEFCYTPVGTKATNEYFQITGVQLEQAPQATAFEFRPVPWELARAQRHNYSFLESTTASVAQSPAGIASATTTCVVFFPFPATMFKAPTFSSNASASTFTIEGGDHANQALSTPYAAVAGANTVNGGSITFTTGATLTQYYPCQLLSVTSGVGRLTWSDGF